jgi:hypothetical protein
MPDPNWQAKFNEWKRRIDRIISGYCGLTSDDLPDCDYANWFDSGVKPVTAAKRVIKNAKEY